MPQTTNDSPSHANRRPGTAAWRISDRDGEPAFDEAGYLVRHPDVADAIRDGSLGSGLEHYVCHGLREGRPSARGWIPRRLRAASSEGGPPLPPAELRARVHGGPDAEDFRQTGAVLALDLLALIDELDALPANARILDFGCGCGRVARFLAPLLAPARYTGVDIDGPAIAWCQDHLSPPAHFARIPQQPPTELPEAGFDLVLAVSVFTHLPEALHLAWLRELARRTRPGGLLIASLHGPEHLPPGQALDRARLYLRGFVYARLYDTEGLPDYYRQAFHRPAYLRRRWPGAWSIEDYRPAALNGDQHAAICRRV